MPHEIKKFIVKVGNAKKQKSTLLMLRMAEAQDLAAEMQQLERSFELLIKERDSLLKRNAAERKLPTVIEIDARPF